MKKEKIGNEVLEHWYAFVDGCQFSSREFYDAVEAELVEREIPHLNVSRPEFFEGSALSDKRTYLRLSRERFAFDICAAPFGTGYFFSMRFVEKPRGGLVQLLLALTLLAVATGGVIKLSESIKDFRWYLVPALLVLLIYLYVKRVTEVNQDSAAGRPAAPKEVPDFDSFLLGLPIIGEWYERRRKDTYFRHDTRLLYHSVVSSVVKKKAEEATAAKGVRLVRQYTYSPIFGELYKAKPSESTPDLVSA
jgi:hypothetical protein